MNGGRRRDGKRVVLLVGNAVWNRHTVATIVDSGANVVGVCVADDRKAGLPLNYIRKAFKRRGILTTTNQILGRIAYRLLNRGIDREHLDRIFDTERCARIFDEIDMPVHFTHAYGRKETRAWLRSLKPDVFVIHTGYWVGKSVRAIPSTGLVIGGHPGLTPHYRGAHSAFWSIYLGKPEDVGYSVFHVDKGVDTGDLIEQGPVEIEPGDTYFSLGWKGMTEIAAIQARLLDDLDRGLDVPRRPHACIPEGTEFYVPGLTHYCRYLLRQKQVR